MATIMLKIDMVSSSQASRWRVFHDAILQFIINGPGSGRVIDATLPGRTSYMGGLQFRPSKFLEMTSKQCAPTDGLDWILPGHDIQI